MLEMVQRTSAHFVYFSCSNNASITDMLNRIGWQSHKLRRLRARLTESSTILWPFPFLRSPKDPNDQNESFPTITVFYLPERTPIQVQSLCRTTADWNLLPPSTGTLDTLDSRMPSPLFSINTIYNAFNMH